MDVGQSVLETLYPEVIGVEYFDEESPEGPVVFSQETVLLLEVEVVVVDPPTTQLELR